MPCSRQASETDFSVQLHSGARKRAFFHSLKAGVSEKFRLPIAAQCFSSEVAVTLSRMAFPRPRKTGSENELYDYAIGALGRRMRSVAELKRLLRPRVDADTEYGQTLVELVIRRLKDNGYLNDSKYAAAYSSFRRDNEKFGRMRVITDLKAKGVHGEVIEQAVNSVYEDVSDEKLAREYLRRKRLVKPKDRKQSARIFRQLSRAGFTSKTIFAILKKWDVDDETLAALEEASETG